jgi:hypothetical protein
MAAFPDPEVDIVSCFDILVRVNGAETQLPLPTLLGWYQSVNIVLILIRLPLYAKPIFSTMR